MSKKYELVKDFYEKKLWTESRVKKAIGKWITQEEADAILGNEASE